MGVKDIIFNNDKKIAWLCDPDKLSDEKLIYTARCAQNAGVDMILTGGSLLQFNGLNHCIETIKSVCSLPVVLFPGNCMQISPLADAILFLSLISGRNADLLIGQHVNVAYQLLQSNMEIIPTGYMLIDSGMPTSVSYISNTSPIPRDKTDIAVSTALAGKLLGLQAIYLEAGSGAALTVPFKCIKDVKDTTGMPVIVGGGITNGKIAKSILLNGADMIVIGNAVEENPDCLYEICSYVKNTHANAEENNRQ